MSCNKNCILIVSGVVGAIIGLISAAMTLYSFEEKADFCYLMKRKAKKAIKQMENKIENKLDC